MQVTRFEAARLKCIEVCPEKAAGTELPLVILLHGRGDWGESYVDFAPAINSTAYRFVFPTAPLPLAGAMFEWFRFDSYNIGAAAAQARRQASQLLDELLHKYNTPAARTVLGGFSQGGIMALEVGLRYPERLAGLVELSGALVADANLNWMNPGDPQLYYNNDRGDLKSALAAAASLK